MKAFDPDVIACQKCGAKATYAELHWEVHNGDAHYLMCQECEAMTDDYPTEQEAVDAWNRGETIQLQGGKDDEGKTEPERHSHGEMAFVESTIRDQQCDGLLIRHSGQCEEDAEPSGKDRRKTVTNRDRTESTGEERKITEFLKVIPGVYVSTRRITSIEAHEQKNGDWKIIIYTDFCEDDGTPICYEYNHQIFTDKTAAMLCIDEIVERCGGAV